MSSEEWLCQFENKAKLGSLITVSLGAPYLIDMMVVDYHLLCGKVLVVEGIGVASMRSC